MTVKKDNDTDIDWSGRVLNFTPGEFSEDPDRWAEPELIYRLQKFRDIMGVAIFPSPDPGALARIDSEDTRSLHFASEIQGVKSRAVDVFVKAPPRRVFIEALASQLWGGIGINFNRTYSRKTWTLFHLDIRPLGHYHAHPTALVWFSERRGGGYKYPQYSDRQMRELLILLERSQL